MRNTREKTFKNSKETESLPDCMSLVPASSKPRKQPRLIEKTLIILAALVGFIKKRDNRPPDSISSIDTKN